MKKKVITSQQIQEYNKKGFLSPIGVLSFDEVYEIKKEIELIEDNWPNEIIELNRNNIHYCSKIFDQLVHNSKILDATCAKNGLLEKIRGFPLHIPLRGAARTPAETYFAIFNVRILGSCGSGRKIHKCMKSLAPRLPATARNVALKSKACKLY